MAAGSRETDERSLGLLSVVAPAHNEAESIAELCERVFAALIVVDDGSTTPPRTCWQSSRRVSRGSGSSPSLGALATRRRSPPASTTPAATSPSLSIATSRIPLS